MKYLDKQNNRDIIESIKRRYILKGTAFVLLSAAILVFFYVYAYDYFADRLSPVSAVGAIVLVLGGLFILMKLHTDVFDKSWEGDVSSIKSQMERSKREAVGVNKSSTVVRGVRGVMLEEYLTFTINTGHDILFYKRPASELGRFKVGDRLRHIKGTRHLQACRKDNSLRDCVMCGAIIRESGDECPHCHMSLVKFDPPASWAKKEDKS